MGGCCGSEESTSSGIQKKQGCTDICCLAIFVVFCFVWIFIAGFSLVYGNPRRLTNGYDSFGNICGSKNTPLGGLNNTGLDMTNRSFVFFLNLSDLIRSLKLCVAKCPPRYLESFEEVYEFAQETGSYLCRYDIPVEDYISPKFKNLSSDTNLWRHSCPKLPIYESVPVLNRCIPKATRKIGMDILYNIYAYLNSIDTFQKVTSDLYASWRQILALVFLALILGFIMTLFIYCFAYAVSWIFMIVLAVASVAGTGVLWWTYHDEKLKNDLTPENELLDEMVHNERAFLTYSIIATIITVILLLIMFFLRKNVKMVVELFKHASECIRSMPCLLLQPVFTFILLFLFLFLWVFVMLSLATSSQPRKAGLPYQFIPSDSNLDPNSQIVHHLGKNINISISDLGNEQTVIKYEDHIWVQYFWWYNIIALVWICEFILACQQMIIAGAVAEWFANRKDLHCPIFKSFNRLFLCHMGSLALGSFLITILKLPRLIIMHITKLMKKYDDNETVRSCKKCINCCAVCLYCLENFIKYINHNAYTIIVTRGDNFCPSTKIAFDILVQHADKVFVLNSVGDFILFLGKCVVTALTGFVGLLLMKHDPKLHFYAVPILVVCIFAFFIAHCFLSVYEMVVDTLFLCFCDDYTSYDGTKDFVSPPQFRNYVLRTARNLDKTFRDRRTESSGAQDIEMQPMKDMSPQPTETAGE